MADPVYATRADVYKYGLPRGALGNPARIAASALASTSTVELEEHGFVQDDAVTFRVTQGGALPSPLVAGTVYYVIPVTDSTFQVAAAQGGSAITLTTDGVSVIVTADLPFDDVCRYYSRFVDGFLPAHAVPLKAPYPTTVVAIVAVLSGKRLQILSGLKSESMDDAEAGAAKQLERWSKGIPARDAAPAPRTNLAISTNTTSSRLGIFSGRGEARESFACRPSQPAGAGVGQTPWGSAIDAAGNPLENVETVTFDLYDNGPSGAGTKVVDWSRGQKQRLILTGNPTLSFVAPPGAGNFLLLLVQDAVGGHTVTWPAGCKFANGGTPPTLTAASSAVDIASIFFDGTSYFVGFSPHWA